MGDMGGQGILDKLRGFFDSLPDFERESSLLGFSGGKDSSTLLHAMAKLSLGPGRAVYVDHRLRSPGELEKEFKIVSQACAEAGVPLTRATVRQGAIQALALRKGIGIEAAAREYRYRIFLAVARARGLRFVLTAHNRDDLLETLLRRVFSSVSSTGLKAIPRLRQLGEGVFVARPLLDLSRREIEEYILRNGILFSEDLSNGEDSFERNKIRKHLKPGLDRVFPGWERGLLGSFEKISADGSFVQEAAREAGRKIVLENGPASTRMRLSEYCRLGDAVRLRILRDILERRNARGTVSWRSVAEYDRSLCKGAKRMKGRGFSFVVSEDEVLIRPSLDFQGQRGYFFLMSGPGESRKKGLRLSLARTTGPAAAHKENALSAQAFDFPLAVRSRKPGDILIVENREFSVDEILKGWKIPPELRDLVPVVEDSRGIVAILPDSLDGCGFSRRKFRSFNGSLGEEWISLTLKGVL